MAKKPRRARRRGLCADCAYARSCNMYKAIADAEGHGVMKCAEYQPRTPIIGCMLTALVYTIVYALVVTIVILIGRI